MDPTSSNPPDSAAPPTSRRKRIVAVLVGLLLVWAVVAYLLMPTFWRHYVRRHPSFADVPRVTHAKTGVPGDPLNVALIGTREELLQIMKSANWHLADPLNVRSSLEIAEASVLKRPYDTAPVSNLYLFERPEDLAFEQPVGNDPRQRHHVRFWKMDKLDDDGRPIWIGSAVFDERVGVSRLTGQITHFVAAAIDEERDKLFGDLAQTGRLAETFFVDDFHKIREGKNGGGHPWHTDGRLAAGVIQAN